MGDFIADGLIELIDFKDLESGMQVRVHSPSGFLHWGRVTDGHPLTSAGFWTEYGQHFFSSRDGKIQVLRGVFTCTNPLRVRPTDRVLMYTKDGSERWSEVNSMDLVRCTCGIPCKIMHVLFNGGEDVSVEYRNDSAEVIRFP